MAKITFTGPTREANAEAARAAAVLAGNAAHVHVIPAEEMIVVYTGVDAPQSITLREITTEEFRDRFTPAELMAAVSSNDAAIKYALLKLSTKAHPVINLDSPEVVATVGRLVTLGLITGPRATSILS